MNIEAEPLEPAAFFSRLYQGVADWQMNIGAEIINKFDGTDLDESIWNSGGNWGVEVTNGAFFRDSELILSVMSGIRIEDGYYAGDGDGLMFQFQYVIGYGIFDGVALGDSHIVIQDLHLGNNPVLAENGKPNVRPIDFSSNEDFALISDQLMLTNGGKLFIGEDDMLHIDVHSGSKIYTADIDKEALNIETLDFLLNLIKTTRSSDAPVFFEDTRSKYVEV